MASLYTHATWQNRAQGVGEWLAWSASSVGGITTEERADGEVSLGPIPGRAIWGDSSIQAFKSTLYSNKSLRAIPEEPPKMKILSPCTTAECESRAHGGVVEQGEVRNE